MKERMGIRGLLLSIALTALVSGCATIEENEIESGKAAFPENIGGPALSGEHGWLEWRGAHRDGVVHGIRLPERLPDGEWSELWRVKVGAGLSGVVAAEGRVYCHSRDGDREIVSAHDTATGRVLWSRSGSIRSWGQPFQAWGISNGPLATPSLSGGRLYTVGIHGLVQCLDAADGRVIFTLDPEDLDGEPSVYEYGHALSPLVRDGRLFVTFATGDGHFLALDAATGDLLWRSLRETIAYSSPVYARMLGHNQIIVRTWERVVGLAAETGDVLWSHAAPARRLTRDCPTPLVLGDVVSITNNFHGTIAVRVSASGDGLSAERIYRTGAFAGRTASPVFHEGHVYGLHKQGFFACIDVRTGSRKWVARDFDDHLSIISFGDRVLALDNAGKLALIELSPDAYRPLAAWRVGEYTWAHMGIDERGLYLRDGDDLLCLPFRVAVSDEGQGLDE